MSKLVKIRVLTSCAGNDFSYGQGETEAPEVIAADLVRAGYAEYLTDTGAKKTVENAASKDAAKSEKR
jgi:hypothetical protein